MSKRQAQKHREASQWLSYKFDRYREDGTDPSRQVTAEEHENLELPLIAETRHGILAAQGPIEFTPCVRPAPRVDLDKVTSAENLGSLDKTAFERLLDVQTWFNGEDIHYQKVLGYGASNLALHYKYGDGPDAKDFVLKIGLEDPLEDPRSRKEESTMHKVERSQHIVQVIEREAIGKNTRQDTGLQPPDDDSSSEEGSSSDGSAPSDAEPEPKPERQKLNKCELRVRSQDLRYRLRRYQNDVADRMAHKDENRDPAENRDYLLLEYMENGSLEQLIWRLNEQKEKCPNRVLWSFWACLIRACIAMTYPLHKFDSRRDDERFDGALSEKIPGNKTKRKWVRRMVHFAIDPSNVLIGKIPTDIDHDEHEHEIVPVLKLAGFGEAEVVKEQKTNWYYERRRICGRHGYQTPEQFGESWDKITPDPTGFAVANQPIAGNYGPAMNVWGIAMTMMSLITRCEPLTPPRVARLKLVARKGDDSLDWWDHFSYGAMLVQEDDEKWKYADEELRETLAKCLARDPAHRPNLQFLLKQAVKKCHDEGPYIYTNDEEPATKQRVLDWMETMLNNARPGQTSNI